MPLRERERWLPSVAGFLPFQASRASLINNQTIANEVTASTHHEPSVSCAKSPTNTTKESQLQVMLSTASARRAELPTAAATRNLRRDKTHIIGIAASATARPGHENSALKAEGKQRNRTRDETSSDRHGHLDQQPRNGETFEEERLPNDLRTLGLGNSSLQHSGSAGAFSHRTARP